MVKSRPAMVYDVFLADQVRDRRDTQALIRVADAHFARIRGSALEYADELDVRLCPLSGIHEELRSLLEEPGTGQ